MTTASDVIAALDQRRTRLTIRPETPGALPGGWQQWLDAMPQVDAHAPGSLAPVWVDTFAQRPLRSPPPRPPLLNRWQSVISLLQQNWGGDYRDERGMRIGSGVVDILLHLVLVSLLLWLMYLRLMMPPPPVNDEEAVQVEFIGRGNIAEGGGALANAGAQSAPASAAPASRAATPAPATGTPDAPLSALPMPQPPQLIASSDAPQRVRELAPPVAVDAPQPLQVTQVAVPQPQAYQLPPPKQREVTLPRVQVRDVQPSQQVEEIATLRPQPVRILQPREVQVQLRTPQLQQPPKDIDVPAPQRLATVPARSAPSAATRSAQVQVPQLRGQVSDIPMPPGGSPTPSVQAGDGIAQQAPSAAGAGGERGRSPTAGAAPAATGQGTRPAQQGGRGVTAAGAGAGPGSKPAPGGWPGAGKSDDWGASKRNVAGTGNGDGRRSGAGRGNGKPGLFNDDGSPRLSDAWTEQAGLDLDRAGTWLKRPGLEYKATRFEQYWIPNGTLLEEWVRKGIKRVSIPIPGTSRRLECVVSLLQFGGGCLPVSDDVNEQPARARPPPDIPFKPELQENNGSVKPANP